MPDYRHEIEFGYFLVPDANDPEGVVDTAALADRLGYDLLGIQDHPYQRRHLDTLSLLGFILARTQRSASSRRSATSAASTRRVREGGRDAGPA